MASCKISFGVTVILIAVVFRVFCAETVGLPFGKEVPVMDGRFEDACWSNLIWHSGFTRLQTLGKANPDTRFKMFHNGKKLFIAVEVFESEIGKLRKEPVVFDSATVWMNDSVELFLCTDPRKQSFYQLTADASGQHFDARFEDNNAGGYKGDAVWSSGAEIKTSADSDRWRLEIALPLGLLDFQSGDWSFNIVRNRCLSAPRQLSSFAPNPGTAHARPEIFLPFHQEGFRPEIFSFRIDNMAAECRRTAPGKFAAEFRVHVSSRAKTMRILRQRVRLLSADGKTVVEKTGKIEVPAGKFIETKMNLEGIVPGSYLLDCQLFDNRSEPTLLTGARQEIVLEYAPISIVLNSPAYRDSIFASMTDKKIEARIDFKDFIGMPFTVELSGKNGLRELLSFPAAKDTQTVRFGASKLPDGNYRLAVTGGSGKAPVEAVRVIRKLPPHPGEVWLDSSGITYIDGKRFFPFGWYGHDDTDVPKTCLNSVLDTALYPDRETLDRAFARRQQLGEKMLIYPYQEFNPRGGWDIFSVKKRNGGLTREQRDSLKKFIPAVRDNPALLGYYLADEPENRDNNPRWYREVYELLRELDPWHPCIMLNWGPGGMRRFYMACDILLPDCYPSYYEDGSTGKPRYCSSEWAALATSLRPAWFMPLAASWPARDKRNVRGVPPSYDDLRSQVFQALIHNVKGFNLYAYFESQRFASLMLGPDAVGVTLHKLRDYFLPDSVPGAVHVATQPEVSHFQAGFKTDSPKQCLIAVNTAMRKVRAVFSFKVPVNGQLFVAGENRTVSLKNNSFTDDFLPGETHIYLNDSGDAASVPSVAGTRQAIAKLRAARKKEGNRIGMGEMLVADYLDYSAGKIPPGVPLVAASSDPGTYFATKQTGSRYYLIDGLTEPKRVEYTWSPAASDRAPYIEIILPEAVPLLELRLYTPCGNLESGSVTVEGKRFLFHNRKKGKPGEKSVMIPVALPGIVSKKIRIGFERFDIDFHTQTPDRRLLSEIELY